MKWFKWIALAGFVATSGCGPDDSVSPTEDFADAWAGEYTGVGSYVLASGQSGVGQPTTMLVEAINPKQIAVAAKLVYGTGRSDFVTVNVLLTPGDSDRLNAEYRIEQSRTVFALVKEGGAISGTIITSSVRVGGTWTQDQSMTIEVGK